jgi:hypothetical protein
VAHATRLDVVDLPAEGAKAAGELGALLVGAEADLVDPARVVFDGSAENASICNVISSRDDTIMPLPR